MTHVLFYIKKQTVGSIRNAADGLFAALLQKTCVAVRLCNPEDDFLPQQLLPAMFHGNKLLHFLRMQSIKIYAT